MNRENPMPVYYQVQIDLKRKIEEGHWLPGEKIPTEKELSDSYSLSAGTIKKAITNLVADGYLYRVAGKGSFVKGTELRRKKLRYYRMYRHFNDKKEANLTIKTISLKKIDPSREHISYLTIRQNQKVYELKRLFSCHDKPLIYSISFLPYNMFQEMEKIQFSDLEKAPIYTLLEEKYGVTTVHNKELFSITAAGPEIAEALNIEVGATLLLIEMLSYTYREKVYEYRKSYCITDNQKVLIEL